MHAPEGLELDDLSVLGPIFVLKVPFTPKELAHKLVAELWLYPDGSRILELSTKCAPTDLLQVYGQRARTSSSSTVSTATASSRPRPRRPSSTSSRT